MDGFFGIGIQELILIAIVALIVLGPERLPAALREIAKFIRQVRNMTNEFTQQFGDDFKALEDLDPRRMLQQAINSIDEEEQAKEKTTKGKSTTTSATAKTTPAKSTVAKTTTDKTTTASTSKPATTKSATTTAKTTTTASTNKPATDSSKEAVILEAATEPQLNSIAPSATQESTTVTTESVASLPEASAGQDATSEIPNRIAPPALEQALQAQGEASANAGAHSVQANGTDNEAHSLTPKDSISAPPVEDTVPHATINTNGAQDHPVTQSE